MYTRDTLSLKPEHNVNRQTHRLGDASIYPQTLGVGYSNLEDQKFKTVVNLFIFMSIWQQYTNSNFRPADDLHYKICMYSNIYTY